ncbi:unnamed protein product [Adineta ricciae]|uniref:Sulfotransferase domain-containing protein n=1 Tax=Adineta ricciae TaxID=249248 RepID=A0A815D358_ADIRI|nr:unnamed protein product [Adineta ricciae]
MYTLSRKCKLILSYACLFSTVFIIIDRFLQHVETCCNQSQYLHRRSSNDSSSLTKIHSYDLVHDKDQFQLRTMLIDYIKTNQTNAVCVSADTVGLHPYHSQIKRTALISFPRSGNTWLRNLIEKSTGYSTSSIYCDKYLEKTLHAECDRVNVFLIKTHLLNLRSLILLEPQRFRYDQFIFLIRNPFDAILSFHQFELMKTHVNKLDHLERDDSNSTNKMYTKRIQLMVSLYARLCDEYEKLQRSHIVVRYEDLKTSPEIILKHIKRFLVPSIIERKGDKPVEFLYYYDNPRRYSSYEKENDIALENEKILCAIADDLLNRDYVYQSYKYDPFHSMKYFSNATIKLIIAKLSKCLCHFHYDTLLRKHNLNISCQ